MTDAMPRTSLWMSSKTFSRWKRKSNSCQVTWSTFNLNRVKRAVVFIVKQITNILKSTQWLRYQEYDYDYSASSIYIVMQYFPCKVFNFVFSFMLKGWKANYDQHFTCLMSVNRINFISKKHDNTRKKNLKNTLIFNKWGLTKINWVVKIINVIRKYSETRK